MTLGYWPARLQSQLEQIYGLDRYFGIEPFIVRQSTVDEDSPLSEVMLDRDEQLVIVQSGEPEEVQLALVLADHVAEPDVPADASPLDATHEAFAAYCALAEGVSHWLYAAWSIHQQRRLSQLELELQAEVDKFALLALSLAPHRRCESLLTRLFEAWTPCPGLSDEELERYERANQLAKAYCTRLWRTFVSGGRRTELVSELRSYYRLTGRPKVAHAQRGEA